VVFLRKRAKYVVVRENYTRTPEPGSVVIHCHEQTYRRSTSVSDKDYRPVSSPGFKFGKQSKNLVAKLSDQTKLAQCKL
jgi:hypothetical protein